MDGVDGVGVGDASVRGTRMKERNNLVGICMMGVICVVVCVV